VTNQLNPILARAHVDDLLRAAAAEQAANVQRRPRGRLAATLAGLRPVLADRRLPAIARPLLRH
jgi:hypothetical protein